MKKINMLLTLLLLCLLCSCGQNMQSTSGKTIRLLTGSGQCAASNSQFEKEVRLEVLSTPGTDIFGREKAPQPVSGVPVTVTSEPGSDLKIIPSANGLTTDVAGTVSFHVKAGKKTGDNYLRVSLGKQQAKSIRFVVGAHISGAEQEGRAGHTLKEPVILTLKHADGKPASGVPVYFSLISTPENAQGAQVLSPTVRTDAEGRAETQVRLGTKTGEYKVAVEVQDPKAGFLIRASNIRFLGLDLLSVIITVTGGLAFFIFGMKEMSDGLLKIAGENMKRMLQFFSRNRVVAILAGTAVTAVVQSSSATTVMVIGFINAGLLTLKQAIGIIFGANIGTTVTAQLIAFNLSFLALPAIAVGFALMLSSRRVVKGWGESIMGFGMIFFGITMMSDELKVLGTFPSFVNVFRSFDCAPVTAGGFMPFGSVVGAILIGALATMIIQSSAAAMGIVLALASGGLVNFYTAIPLLIGTNIGTTITAVLAAITANRVAKQAALAHFMFNMIGTLMMVILFYIPYGPDRVPCFLYFINSITPGNAFAAVPQNIERHIAMAHTFFNVFTVILLTPLIGQFTRLCEKLLPIRDPGSVQTNPLEPHLLATPAVAIEQVINQLHVMVCDSWKMVEQAVNQHFIDANVDPDAFEKLQQAEDRIDTMQTDITNYLVQITRRPLTGHQARIIPLLMHCTNDAERIADHTDNILKLTKRLAKTGAHLSDVAKKDIGKLWSVLEAQAANVANGLESASGQNDFTEAMEHEKKINKLAKKYEKNYTRVKDASDLPPEPFVGEFDDDSENIAEANPGLSADVIRNEEEINKLARQYEKEHVDRRNAGKCALEPNVIFVEMLWELEKLGDHLANIAVRTPQIQQHFVKL